MQADERPLLGKHLAPRDVIVPQGVANERCRTPVLPRPQSDRDAIVWTSADGLTWSRLPHDEAVFGGPQEQKMHDVAAADLQPPGLAGEGRGETGRSERAGG